MTTRCLGACVLGVLLFWAAAAFHSTPARDTSPPSTPTADVDIAALPGDKHISPFGIGTECSKEWPCRIETAFDLAQIGERIIFAAGMYSSPQRAEPTGCEYDVTAFDTIRHQSRLARQAGRHDKATVLDFAAALLRCQPEELERKLAAAMSDVWNGVADWTACPDGYKKTNLMAYDFSCCRPHGLGQECLVRSDD